MHLLDFEHYRESEVPEKPPWQLHIPSIQDLLCGDLANRDSWFRVWNRAGLQGMVRGAPSKANKCIRERSEIPSQPHPPSRRLARHAAPQQKLSLLQTAEGAVNKVSLISNVSA